MNSRIKLTSDKVEDEFEVEPGNYGNSCHLFVASCLQPTAMSPVVPIERIAYLDP